MHDDAARCAALGKETSRLRRIALVLLAVDALLAAAWLMHGWWERFASS